MLESQVDHGDLAVGAHAHRRAVITHAGGDDGIQLMHAGIAPGVFVEQRNHQIAREQLATFLYRYDWLGEEEPPLAEEDYLSGFEDGDTVSDYALNALNWAAGEGIVTGMPGNLIEPAGAANRAQAATMLHRYLN